MANVSPVVIQNCWFHAGLINKDSLVTNSQETNESVPAATLDQTSDVHVQAVLMKLAAAGSLLSAAEYINIWLCWMSDEEIVQVVLCNCFLNCTGIVFVQDHTVQY